MDSKIDFDSKPVRLQKLLAACGVASRRGAERLIVEGRVKVNGVTAGLGQSAVLYRDSITVDEIKITGKDKRIYLMLNKPRGYITTKIDQRGRKTVMELVADVGMHIFPVGRLDKIPRGCFFLQTTVSLRISSFIRRTENKKYMKSMFAVMYTMLSGC